MDKNMLKEKQRLLKEKENFEHRENHLGQGLADLNAFKVPAHELPKEVEFDKVIVPDDKAIVDEEGHELLSSKADLVNGKVPAEELPSYVDDVINGYLFNGAFFADAEHTEELEAEEGKIYVDLATNHTYRYSGVAYVQVGGELPTAVNGRFLHANDSTGALEWSEVKELPEITAGDEGKALVVDDGVATWGDAGSEGMEILDLTNGNYQYGTLTDEQFAIAISDHCIIKLLDKTFYKSAENIGYPEKLLYITPKIETSSFSMSQSRIEINSSTKKWSYSGEYSIVVNPSLAGNESDLTGLQIGTTKYKISNVASEMSYLTVAPTEANTDGKLKFVVLSEEPTPTPGYQDGYYYIITESNL